MAGSQVVIILTIAIYLLAMVLVGVYFGRKGSGKSSDDFYLGGRKMGPLVTAMSAEASDMSSYLLMGLPGLAYLCGLPEVTWTCIGLAVGTAAAPLFRTAGRHHRAGLFLPAVRGSEEPAFRHCSGHYSGVLRPLYRLRL